MDYFSDFQPLSRIPRSRALRGPALKNFLHILMTVHSEGHAFGNLNITNVFQSRLGEVQIKAPYSTLDEVYESTAAMEVLKDICMIPELTSEAALGENPIAVALEEYLESVEAHRSNSLDHQTECQRIVEKYIKSIQAS